ncbi:MAG: dTDP-4-dehydrorhamnose reductase [Deltaproteobacteria bacterium]
MPNEPILVLGASGMLGRALLAELGRRGLGHRGASHAEIDLARPASLEAGLPRGTSTVINCAGWTNVDGAESQEAEATAVNGQGVGALAARCRQIGAVLVHYSTDYVFSGKADAPYATDQPRAPINAYGRSKAVGEQLLEQSGARHLLLRTSWVYAPWGKNFVRTIVRLAGQRASLSVVNDQLGRPSSAEQIARATLDLLDGDALGTFHVSDDGQCTWFEFAQAVVGLAGLPCKVEPCSSAQFPSPAVRPSYSVLDLSSTRARVGTLTPWQDCLADVMRRLEPAG